MIATLTDPEVRTADECHRGRLVHDLGACREIDALDVRVAVQDGVVTVTGEVGSSAERLAIRSIMLGDRATTDVIDDLRVAPLPGEWKLRDDEIAALVSERLRVFPELAEVHPSCDFHIVHLYGVVAEPADRRIAHHLARTTPGVHFVIDQVESVTRAR